MNFFDRVRCSVGRKPNSESRSRQDQGKSQSRRRFIQVNDSYKPTTRAIFAIGDVVGEPMLACTKPLTQGRIRCRAIAGHKVAFEPNATPAVVFHCIRNPRGWISLKPKRRIRAAKTKGKVSVGSLRLAPSRSIVPKERRSSSSIRITESVLGAGIVVREQANSLQKASPQSKCAQLPPVPRLTIHPHPNAFGNDHGRSRSFLRAGHGHLSAETLT